jgi:hypothetical protein
LYRDNNRADINSDTLGGRKMNDKKYIAKITTVNKEIYTILLEEKGFRLLDFLDGEGLIQGVVTITSFDDEDIEDFT